MSDDFDPDDVAQVIQDALGELLNIAASVAELQTTDEGAEEIYAICDLVAEYYQIERARAVTIEHEDGSYTTHFETFVGSGDVHSDNSDTLPRQPIPGHIRTKGKPKLRLVDNNTPTDPKPKKK
jgi:hypothetical protein